MRRSSRPSGSLHPRAGAGAGASSATTQESIGSRDSSKGAVVVSEQNPFVLPLAESLREEEEEENVQLQNNQVTEKFVSGSRYCIDAPKEGEVPKRYPAGIHSNNNDESAEEEDVEQQPTTNAKRSRHDDGSNDSSDEDGAEDEMSANQIHGTVQVDIDESLFAPASSRGRASAQTLGTSQTQVDPRGSDLLPDDTQTDSFFKQALLAAGVLLESESRGQLGGFALASTVTSLASIMSSLRTSVWSTPRGESFMAGLEAFVANDSNLSASLAPLRVPSSSSRAGPISSISSDPSLMRLLLKVDSIQPRMIQLLLDLFLARALEDDAADEAPPKLLKCLSWLDFIAKPGDLAEHYLQTLRGLSETQNRWLRDAVQALPEVVPDSEHPRAVAHLLVLLRETREGTSPLIDAFCDLKIPPNMVDEISGTVLDMLRSAPVAEVPMIVKFLLVACSSAEPSSQARVLNEMRSRLIFLGGKKGGGAVSALDIASNEALIVKELHHGLLIHPVLCQRFFETLRGKNGEETCVDVWILVALSHSAAYAQQAVEMLRGIALKTGGDEVFEQAIVGHGATLDGYLNELLDMAGAFLRVGPQTKGAESLKVFAQKLYRWLFNEMSDARSRQEIVHALVSHCGVGGAGRSEVDGALRALRSIVRLDSGAIALGPFSSYVRSLLNDLDDFDVTQARYLFRIVSRLALVDGEGVNELKILLRKLLISPDPHRQSLGIVGTVQLVACLSPSLAASSDGRDEEGDAPKNATGAASARNASSKKRRVISANTQLEDEDEIVDHERPHGSGSSSVNESMALVDYMLKETRHPLAFDELGRVVERGALDVRLVRTLSVAMQEAFEEWFLFDEESRARSTASTLANRDWFALERPEDINNISVKILPVLELAQSDPRCRNRLALLCPMMRCLLATTTTVDSCPDAILGCPLVLPNPSAIEALDSSSHIVREMVCTAFYYAADWMREIVSSFASVPNLEAPLMRLLCARLNTLVQAQAYLSKVVLCVPEFAPPSVASTTASGQSFSLATVRPSKGRVATKGKRSSSSNTVAKMEASSSTKLHKAVVNGKKKKKKSSTAVLNGMDPSDEEAESEGSSSSSEDETQRDPGKSARKAAVSSSSDDEVDGDGEGGETENPGDDEEATKPQGGGRKVSPQASVAMVLASLRELSPNSLSLLGVQDMRLVFGEISEDLVRNKENDLPQIHVSALRAVLESCARQLRSQLPETATLASSRVKRIDARKLSNGRASDFEPDEILDLVIRHCLCPLHGFVEQLCKRICTSAPEAEPLSHADVTDSVACIEIAAVILSLIIRYEPLRRSHAAFAVLLRALEAFSSLSPSKTVQGGRGTFSADHPELVDAKPLVAKALRSVFDFFVKHTCESGALSNSMSSQIVVIQLLRSIVVLHDELDSDDEEKSCLRDSFSKLAKVLLKREWSDPSGQGFKIGKENVGVLLDVFHTFARNPLEAIRATVEELKAFLGKDEAGTALTFTLLNERSLKVFFSAAIGSLARLPVSREDENDLCFVRKLSELFSECVLLTKADAAAKLPVLRDAVRYGKTFLDNFVKRWMKFLSTELKRQQQDVLEVLQIVQKGTRQLNNLCTHGKCKKDASIVALTPALRRVLESFILSTKSMLKANNCDDSLTVGTLKARHVDGSVVKLDDVEEDD